MKHYTGGSNLGELSQQGLVQMGVTLEPVTDHLIATDVRCDLQEYGSQPFAERRAPMDDVIPVPLSTLAHPHAFVISSLDRYCVTDQPL